VSRIRVAGFVVSLVAYQHARWNAFGAEEQFEACLIQITSRDDFRALEHVPEGTRTYHTRVLFPDTPFSDIPAAAMKVAVWETLDQFKPQVVCLNGYWAADSWSALLWCKKNRVPAILFSESNAFDQKRAPWKEALKSKIISSCSAGLVGSRAQGDYLASLGLNRNHVFEGYDVVDNAYYESAAEYFRSDPKSRRSLPQTYFLACARFEAKKNLQGLVEAYALYREMNEQTDCWHLVLVGDGELRIPLEEAVHEQGLSHFVHLAGAQSAKTIPLYYAHARAFIHASTTEQWGLVVNEAMACGLPVLVSNRCGCASDLVAEGINGFTFDPTSREDIAAALSKMSHGSPDLAAMGSASREIIAYRSPALFASGLSSAVETALLVGPKKVGAPATLILNLLLRK